MSLDAVDKVHRRIACVAEPDVIEDKKLGFRSEVGGVGDTG